MSPRDVDRVHVTVRLSPESHQAWHDLTVHTGITIAVMIEMLGPYLLERYVDDPTLDGLVPKGRGMAAARGRRS